jgi:uncharacterized protein YkvS
MITLTTRPKTSDVIEFDLHGERVTGLVLLASDNDVIVDLCDDQHVFVTSIEELKNLSVFGDDFALAA